MIPEIFKELELERLDRAVLIVDYRCGQYYAENGISYEDIGNYVSSTGNNYMTYDPETLPEAHNDNTIKTAMMLRFAGIPVIVVCANLDNVNVVIREALDEMRNIGNRSIAVTTMVKPRHIKKYGRKLIHAEDDVIIFD